MVVSLVCDTAWHELIVGSESMADAMHDARQWRSTPLGTYSAVSCSLSVNKRPRLGLTQFR